MEGSGADVDLGKADLWASSADSGANCGSDIVNGDDVGLTLDIYCCKGGFAGGRCCGKVAPLRDRVPPLDMLVGGRCGRVRWIRP